MLTFGTSLSTERTFGDVMLLGARRQSTVWVCNLVLAAYYLIIWALANTRGRTSLVMVKQNNDSMLKLISRMYCFLIPGFSFHSVHRFQQRR